MKRPIIFILSAMLSVTLFGCKSAETPPTTAPSEPAATQPQQAETGDETIPEDAGIPFVTEYIVLSYPSELEDMVSIQYEELTDGQQIIFTTGFTGEELELFRFSISKSGTDGYQLGTLKDETEGELLVCMDVKDYSNGSRTPEEYTKLTAMQDRVNDIIIQFYEDPRFTPS